MCTDVRVRRHTVSTHSGTAAKGTTYMALVPGACPALECLNLRSNAIAASETLAVLAAAVRTHGGELTEMPLANNPGLNAAASAARDIAAALAGNRASALSAEITREAAANDGRCSLKRRGLDDDDAAAIAALLSRPAAVVRGPDLDPSSGCCGCLPIVNPQCASHRHRLCPANHPLTHPFSSVVARCAGVPRLFVHSVPTMCLALPHPLRCEPST